jgi:hypothetical protein
LGLAFSWLIAQFNIIENPNATSCGFHRSLQLMRLGKYIASVRPQLSDLDVL